MEIRFDRMTAVVTGGAAGIGLATARILRDAGARVFVFDRERIEEDGLEPVVVDLTNDAAFAIALDAVGRVDVAILNAGICRPGGLFETTREQWQATIDVNLSAVFFNLQQVAKRMRGERAGSIVLTASTNSFDGEAGLIAYNASKAGVLGILHTAANELGPYGIRVNAVCPGLIETKLTAEAFASEEIVRPYFAALPLGRGGSASEVGQAIAFLASSMAGYITGAALYVDGGQMAAKFGVWDSLDARFDGKRWKLNLPERD